MLTYQRVKTTGKARPSQRFPEAACFYDCHIRKYSASMALDGVGETSNTLKINARRYRGEFSHQYTEWHRHGMALFCT